ncbi:MAG: long-chain fatty acid--CoA ligase [alpha proteobacterium HIMB114]|nr:MAG: long-chain fatty acid--CoA ligase [alpha proteobacterium HIMB114]
MDYSNLDNLYELFELQSKNYNKKKFLHSINADKSLNTFSWKDVSEKTILISNFLRNQGVVKGDRVMLVSEGRPEWMISDLSILRTGAVTVPNYTTYTQKDFEFVLNDCRPKGLIVSNYKLYKIIIDASKKINFNFEFILSFDEINNIMNLKKIDIKEDKVVNNCRRLDPACIIYTSGTQGNPKGVILSHGGILANCEDSKNLVQKLKINNPRFLTWLPLSHSYEHTVQFVQISLGAKVYYSPSIEKLLENIKIAKPHVLTAVPRFYNNLYNKMLNTAKKSSKIKKLLFFKTLKLGEKRFIGNQLSSIEKIINKILDILVRKKVINNFGGNLRAFVSGGGPLDKNVGTFLNALGLKTLQGYGLTETSPVVSCNPVNKIKIDTVGIIFSNNKVKIADDGEILVKGENVMLGYWNNDTATNEVIKNGWLHTGDIGEIDHDGYLKITDRKKDIIVSVGGDNISPSKIENLLCLNDEIEQAYVDGDNQKFLVCLLVLNKNFKRDDKKIKSIIDETNKELTQIEKIKKFDVIKDEFTISNELLTPTMKIRRHKIKLKYKKILENFYKY